MTAVDTESEFPSSSGDVKPFKNIASFYYDFFISIYLFDFSLFVRITHLKYVKCSRLLSLVVVLTGRVSTFATCDHKATDPRLYWHLCPMPLIWKIS